MSLPLKLVSLSTEPHLACDQPQKSGHFLGQHQKKGRARKKRVKCVHWLGEQLNFEYPVHPVVSSQRIGSEPCELKRTREPKLYENHQRKGTLYKAKETPKMDPRKEKKNKRLRWGHSPDPFHACAIRADKKVMRCHAPISQVATKQLGTASMPGSW